LMVMEEIKNVCVLVKGSWRGGGIEGFM